MGLYNAMKEEFEEVTFLGKQAILTPVRINETTVPNGYYKYEFCDIKVFEDDPIEIARSITHNHCGTIIMRDEIRLPAEGSIKVRQDALRLNTGDCQSMQEFMSKYPPLAKPPKSIERQQDLREGVRPVATKYHFIADLYEHTLGRMTETPKAWMEFLRSACCNYKCRFDEQVLIYAQRPDAAAVLELEKWNIQFGRWVKKGAKGIAVFDEGRPGNKRLRHYFDISDTHESRVSRPVPIWEVATEHKAEIIESLRNSYDEIAEGHPFTTALILAAANASSDNTADYLTELLSSRRGSLLEDADENAVAKQFGSLVANGVAYMLMSRCGIDTSKHFKFENFKDINSYNTPETINALGLATRDIAEMVLREISATVLNIQKRDKQQNRTFALPDKPGQNITKIQNIEGGVDNGTDLSDGERLSDTEPRAEAGTASNPWQVRIFKESIPEEPQKSHVLKPDDVRQAERTSSGHRTDSEREDGNNDRDDGEGRGFDGETESGRPHEMDGVDEQHQERSGGDDTERPHILIEPLPTEEEQISFLDEAEEQKTSAFSISQQTIDEILTSGGIEPGSTKHIVAHFKKGYSNEKNAEFLREEYRAGGKGFIIDGNHVSLWFDKDGIQIARGDTVRSATVVHITWELAAKRIRELLDLGRYVPQNILDEVDAQEIKDLAESIWYLCRDRSEEAEFPFIDADLLKQGFPKATAQLIEILAIPEGQQKLHDGFIEFAEAVRQDNSLLRFRSAHNNLEKLLIMFSGLKREQLTFTAAETLPTIRPGFITQDEVDQIIVGGSGIQDGKHRIYSYFLQNHSAKEKAEFLKNEFGIGGTYRTGLNKSHDSKGVELSRGNLMMPFDKIMLTWPKIAKRIDELIIENRYMSQSELDSNPEYEADSTGQILNRAAPELSDTPETIPIVDENVEYELTLGATVHLGIEEYEISAFDEKRVLLYDPQAPLFTLDMPHEEFDRKLRENPMNNHLIIKAVIQEKNVTEPGLEAEIDEYMPKPGDFYEMQGRFFTVESVDPQSNNVSLRDSTFEQGTGFPIFRSESIDYVRMYEPIQIPDEFIEPTQEIQTETPTPSWEKPKALRRVQSYDLYPDIPMSERHDYRITDDDLGAGGQKTKFRANADAIRNLQAIEQENRFASPEEQEILAKYVGWGSIQQAFDENNETWAKEYLELKSLLSDDEYNAARASTLNAFYTSPIVIKAIYKAVENIGFRAGNVLEPSCGVGNFLGLLPDSMSGSKLFGVELDNITGRIAQQLYQKSSIAVQGYETTTLPDSFFDLAIGNVPFGAYKVQDKKYDKHNFNIHEYFFAKTLDKVRPGGIVAFVTSMYTMDKQNSSVRKYIAQRSELLGAIRLPNNAFTRNAGTEVTSDIIFLQKRDRCVDIVPDWVHLSKTGDGFAINSYFVEHPEMILGELSNDSGTRLYGREDSVSCVPFPETDLSDLLSDAIVNIHAEYTDYERDEGDTEPDNSIPADPAMRNYSYTLVNGQIYYRQDSRMIPVEMPVTAENRVKGLIGLRECARNLVMYQAEDYPDSDITEEQAKLNRLYDRFLKKYGLINTRGNSMAFAQDSSYCLLCALEVLDENGELKRKADMFTKRTIKAYIPVTHVDTAVEALAVSLSEKARVELPFMTGLTGMTENELINELEGIIFRDVGDVADFSHQFVTADEYLSGNVREKLKLAREAHRTFPDGRYASNVKALESVMPEDLTAADISVRLGATWLPQDVVQEFVHHLLQPSYWARDRIKVFYSHYTGAWNITDKSSDRSNIHVFNTYGTQRINAYHIMENTLNLRDVRVFDKVYDEQGNEKRVLNKKETAIAMAKQEMICRKFDEWVWADPGRRERLCRIYNDKFNSTRPRVYDGSHLTFPGMNPEIVLRKHQIDAIARIIYGGNTLLAHEVGAGKTYEMVAAAMEGKRLGLCNKSLIVVPNHITEQWSGEFLQLYPSARILVATRKDFETKNRKKFCARIATGDYDAIIIGHSQFEKIPISRGRQQGMLQQQIFELVDAVEELKANRGERTTVKQLERMRKTLEVKLAKLNDQSRKDDVVTFEELGIDRLFIDEAHYYKNLFLITKMRNVGGIAQTEAQKSSDLFAKCRYLDEITGARGTVFATGTPISNSMTEMYTMQRYLQYGALLHNNLQHFDAWASTFGETVTAIELAPEGTGYRAKTRFAKYYNLPELMAMFRSVADIQTADMLLLPVPGANFHTEVLKPSEWQKEMIAGLAQRAEAIRGGNVDPAIDNMLKITNDGRKLALDQRIVNPMLPDEPDGKVARCAENVFQIWEEHKLNRLTQLVFSDISTPKNDGAFNVYNDLKDKLVAKGIPEHEIAFIHNADTETRKKELFAKVRRGQVRILLGSTPKMGSGTNVQDRLIALHDLDCPWRPSDLAQRLGRIVRQGNRNPVVEIYRYVTEGTFDSYLYQLVENKQKFVSQIMTSKLPVRSAEDIDETALSYAEIKALATGNPLIIEKCQLEMDVNKLKILHASHLSQKYALEDKILKEYPREIKRLTEWIEGYMVDIEMVKQNTPTDKEAFPPMKIGGILYDEKAKAGTAILEACKNMASPDPVPLGEYRGFRMDLSFDTFAKEYLIKLYGKLSHEVKLGADIHGNITRIDNALEGMQDKQMNCQANLENVKTQLETAKGEQGRIFPQEKEFSEKSARLKEVNILLNMDQKDHEILDSEPDEGDLPPQRKTPGLVR